MLRTGFEAAILVTEQAKSLCSDAIVGSFIKLHLKLLSHYIATI
jgi:hypothetical protein